MRQSGRTKLRVAIDRLRRAWNIPPTKGQANMGERMRVVQAHELWTASKDEIEGDARDFATAIAYFGSRPGALLPDNLRNYERDGEERPELVRALAIAFAAGRRWRGTTERKHATSCPCNPDYGHPCTCGAAR